MKCGCNFHVTYFMVPTSKRSVKIALRFASAQKELLQKFIAFLGAHAFGPDS